jgi:hypothetical protein
MDPNVEFVNNIDDEHIRIRTHTAESSLLINEQTKSATTVLAVQRI